MEEKQFHSLKVGGGRREMRSRAGFTEKIYVWREVIVTAESFLFGLDSHVDFLEKSIRVDCDVEHVTFPPISPHQSLRFHPRDIFSDI